MVVGLVVKKRLVVGGRLPGNFLEKGGEQTGSIVHLRNTIAVFLLCLLWLKNHGKIIETVLPTF
jgi:hypothetical protein